MWLEVALTQPTVTQQVGEVNLMHHCVVLSRRDFNLNSCATVNDSQRNNYTAFASVEETSSTSVDLNLSNVLFPYFFSLMWKRFPFDDVVLLTSICL